MQLKLNILVAAVAQKGSVMGINNKKHKLSRAGVSFIMLLFAVCLTVNVLFCGAYNFYELLGETTVSEPWAHSESIVTGEGSNDTDFVKAAFLNKNNSYNETIMGNIPEEMSLLLFLIIVFLLFFLTLFILLPDGWTLINHKVRLDN